MKTAPILGGELLSDLDKTVGMLRRPFKSSLELLTRMVKARRRWLGKTTASVSKANANAWLEYRYGWKPILMDADMIFQHAHRVRNDYRLQRLVARHQIEHTCESNKEFNVAGVGTWSTASIVGHANVTLKQRAAAGVVYEVLPRTSTEALQTFLGARPKDLPATLWEILPYSFVADWFVNVGSWISAVTPVSDINVLGHWNSTVEQTTRTQSASSLYFPLVSGDVHQTLFGNLPGSSTFEDQVRRFCTRPLPSLPAVTSKTMSLLHSVDGLSLSLKPILGLMAAMKH